jgi:hypothetical protein
MAIFWRENQAFLKDIIPGPGAKKGRDDPRAPVGGAVVLASLRSARPTNPGG